MSAESTRSKPTPKDAIDAELDKLETRNFDHALWLSYTDVVIFVGKIKSGTEGKLAEVSEYIEGRIEHANCHVGEGWEQVIRELKVIKERIDSASESQPQPYIH